MNTAWRLDGMSINPSPARLLVIILNYRTPDQTLACLTSLADEAMARSDVRVVVVDNASGDGSVERVQAFLDSQGWGTWVSVLPLTENNGYATGNNAAIRQALAEPTPPEYILLLNPDTQTRPGALAALVVFMDAHPTVGVVGSRLEDPDGTPQCSAFRFPTLWSEFEAGARLGLVTRVLGRWVVWQPIPARASPTDWLAGACLLIRSRVFHAAGLLDSGYFLYYEDVDWCRQAWRAGWPCWYVPTSRVIHLVGQSTGVTDTRQTSRRLPDYWFEARRRYFIKNHGQLYVMLADVAALLGYALWQGHRRLRGKPNVAPPHFGRDLWRHSLFGKGYPAWLNQVFGVKFTKTG